MFEQLNYLGVPPSKRTLSVNFPSLKKSFKLAFIRGYADNNSCISYNRGKFSQMQIGGPRHFLEPMGTFLEKEVQLKKRTNMNDRIVARYPSASFALQYTNGSAVKICQHLYGNIKDIKEIRHRNRNRILKVL